MHRLPARRWSVTLMILVVGLLLGSVPVAAQITSTARPDLGDAPTGSNSFDQTMEAYPNVIARFPTVATTVGASGPLHRNPVLNYHLGPSISAEEQADSGVDSDDVNNIDPENNSADNDAFDDGLDLPTRMGHCVLHELSYRVTSMSAAQPYVNVWIDWNRDGAWSDATFTCPDGEVVPEWAVQNQRLTLNSAGFHDLTLSIRTWRPDLDAPAWLRISLSDVPAPSAAGNGPLGGYAEGETEDYLIEPAGNPERLPAPIINSVEFEAIPGDTGETFIFLPMVRNGALAQSIFQASDLPIANPGGQLREVAVAHVGGAPRTDNRAIIVTAAGTGAAVRLSSWTVNNNPSTPVYLKDSPNLIGIDVQLHVLTPTENPKAQYNLLISAIRRNGNLWLSTWRLNTNGDFTLLSTRGYGSNADVQVNAYGIAHRELTRTNGTTFFQVATPVLAADNQMRMITWSVNPTTGFISGLHDSGDWEGTPDPNTQLSTAWIPGGGLLPPHFAVSYRSSNGVIQNYFWAVNGLGVPSYNGHGISGLDIRGNNPVTVSGQSVAIAPLTGVGFLAAVRDSTSTLPRLISWENQPDCRGDEGCFAVPHFISDQNADNSPNTLGVTLPAPTLTTNRALLRDTKTSNPLFVRNIGSTNFQGIASVTKVMTLIVTLDAIAAGTAGFDDIVTTSAAAAAIGGSQLGLEEGETQSLRTLLHGLMVNSGNDASIAIAEHIGGSEADFVILMNERASALNLSSTIYCQPSGGCFSTPADQVALWEAVHTNPLFQQFAGEVSYAGCGESAGGSIVCHVINKTLNSYPGLESDKGGSLGFFCNNETSTSGVPLCSSGGCLTSQATRMNRTLIQTILQPQPLSANRGPDSRALFDYGYRLLFTPDARGAAQSVSLAAAADFDIDAVSSTLAVSAVIDGQTVRLRSWGAQPATGVLEQVGCATRAITTLTASTRQPAISTVEVVLQSSLSADGNYLVGHRNGTTLQLRMWRLGFKI